jgi:hypothetical protein
MGRDWPQRENSAGTSGSLYRLGLRLGQHTDSLPPQVRETILKRIEAGLGGSAQSGRASMKVAGIDG